MATTSPPGDGAEDRSAPGPPSGEPDYRVTLAAERTFLAYARTSLALLAAGVAVVAALPDTGQVTLRRIVGVLLTGMGVFVVIDARRHFAGVLTALRTGSSLPRSRVAAVVTVGLVLCSMLTLVIILVPGR